MILAKNRFILLFLGAGLLLPFQMAVGQTSSISELRDAIDAVIADANMPNAWWTVNVKEVESGNALYQKDTGRVLFRPQIRNCTRLPPPWTY
jgi:hypothetical protein